MRRHGFVPVLAAAICLFVNAAAGDAISTIMQAPASRLEPGLPDEPFSDWLRKQLPPGVFPVFRTGACGAAAGICVNIETFVTSRARTLSLACAVDPPRFLGGTVTSHDGARERPIRSLSNLPDHLSLPMRPPPLECPEGTRNMLRESEAGLHEWCRDARGRKDGPARSWYRVGRRLMSRGRYERGERTGLWTGCDRSEHCRTRRYP